MFASMLENRKTGIPTWPLSTIVPAVEMARRRCSSSRPKKDFLEGSRRAVLAIQL